MLNLIDGFKDSLENNYIYINGENSEYIFVVYQHDKFTQYIRTLTTLNKENLKYHKNFLNRKIYKQVKDAFKLKDITSVYIYDKQERARRKVINSKEDRYLYYVNNFEKDFVIYNNKDSAINALVKDFINEYGDITDIIYDGKVVLE